MLSKRENRRSLLKMIGGGAASAYVVFGAANARATFEGDEEPLSTPAPPSGDSEAQLTVYSGQHEDMVVALGDAFKAKTGITLAIRSGHDSDLANQIIEEGDQTNADIFITEEPGPAATLDDHGLLAPINESALAKTDARFNPENGHWLGYAARARAIFYNPELIAESDLPTSILDLVDEKWAETYAYAPSGAFTGTVSYLINTMGEEKTLEWLKGIEKTGKNLLKNGAIRDAVEAGQIAFGLSNHYYWYILAKEKGGPENLSSRVHFVKNEDPGGLIFASAAAIPVASKNQELAQQFVDWLADPEGGQAVVAAVSPQYPLAPGVESSYDLPPLSELEPPVFDQGILKDSEQAVELILEAGII